MELHIIVGSWIMQKKHKEFFGKLTADFAGVENKRTNLAQQPGRYLHPDNIKTVEKIFRKTRFLSIFYV